MAARAEPDPVLDPAGDLSRAAWQATEYVVATLEEPLAREYQAVLLEAGDEAAQAYQVDALAAAGGYVEAEHPRDPGGEGGGQWIEKGAVWEPDTSGFAMRPQQGGPQADFGVWSRDPGELTYQSFDPNVTVVPYGGYNLRTGDALTVTDEVPDATWWKASLNRDTGEVAVWVPGRMTGYPHHLDMGKALGWPGSDDIRDVHRWDVIGVGDIVEPEMWEEGESYEREALTKKITSSKIQRQLREAREMYYEARPLAASATWETLLAAGNRERAEVGHLVDQDEMERQAVLRTRRMRQLAVALVADAALESVGVSFDVAPGLAASVIDQIGIRAEDLGAAARQAVSAAVTEGLAEGWSVPETAGAIRASVAEASPARAVALARTDLVGLANASSMASARLVLGPDVYKRWWTAHDERVRPTHVEANGQTVLISEKFKVGEALLDFPGDQDGPDEEVIQCRCVPLYVSVKNGPSPVVTAAGYVEAEHPRDPGGEGGGQWITKEGRRTLAGDRLVKRLAADTPENVKALWDADPRDSVATLLDLNNAPSLATIEAAKRAAVQESRDWFKARYPDGVTVYRGGPSEFDEPLVAWTPNRQTALFFARKDPDLVRQRFVRASDVVVALRAINPGGRGFAGEDEVWLPRTETLTAAYVEAEHPRDPGGEGGGQWIEKGAIGTFKEVPEAMAAGLVKKKKRELDAVAGKVAGIPVPTPKEGTDYGISPPEEFVSGGGYEFYRSSGGAFHLSGPMVSGLIYRDTAEEILQVAYDNLAASEELARGNWASRLRGKTYTLRNSPVVMKLFEDATAYNQTGEAWTEYAARWGLDEQPILLNEAGTQEMGKDVLTSGWYDPAFERVFISGDMWQIKDNLSVGGRIKDDLVGPMKAGAGSGGHTAPGLLRHEFSHQAWSRMSEPQRAEFLTMVPSDKETLQQLTFYASAAEEYYGGRMFGDGMFPWQGEVFAEAAAATLDPNYDPSEWPEWVDDMGKWIRAQERQR